MSAAVSTTDRLSFTIFLALVIHAMIILGVSFSASDRSQIAKTLEVTLATSSQDKAPEQADFIAQHNQQGSGSEELAQMLTTDVESAFHNNLIQKISPQQQQASAPKQQQAQKRVVSSQGNNPFKIKTEQPNALPAPSDLPDGPRKSLLQQSLEIASLEAKIDSQRQLYAKRQKVKRLTSASTMKASDAYYVNSWRRRIERNGSRNYPPEARHCASQSQDCELRVRVAINPDGTIYEIEILQRSPFAVLNDTVVRILRQSAPFAPFSAEMRKDTDRLDIIRTWRFRGNRYLPDAN